MEDFSKYSGINRTFFQICCMFWIFSAAEGNTISAVLGSKVTLHCYNESTRSFNQLTWKINGENLITFSSKLHSHISEKAHSLNINTSESQMYTLVIERVQMSHAGNYTCETSTNAGVGEQTWELIITDGVEPENRKKLIIAVAATVPCVCCLIFILAFIILRRVHKQRAEQEQTEHIYENCQEAHVSHRRGYNHSSIINPGLTDMKCSPHI